MKSYEVKQISTILSHFYNLEKLKNMCFYCVENNIFSNYSGWAASKLFFWKMPVFYRFHGWGNVQLVFKQNRPLWERAFLGALCTWNGLVCSLQSHLCSFFSFYKDKKNKKQKNKKQKKQDPTNCIWPPPLGVCNLVFFCFFWFLGVLLSWFVVSFEGLAKKVAGSNSLPLFPP